VSFFLGSLKIFGNCSFFTHLKNF